MATTKNQETSADKNAALIALGRQIREVREGRNISQEAFAATAGIARSYYGGIERGERNVAALNLINIAAALGVEVGELFPPVRDLGGLKEGAKRETTDDNREADSGG